MAKSWKEPFEPEAVKEFLVILGAQLATSVEFPGRPDLPHPTNRQELLASLDRKMRLLRDSHPHLREDVERMDFALREGLEAVLFPDRVSTSNS